MIFTVNIDAPTKSRQPRPAQDLTGEGTNGHALFTVNIQGAKPEKSVVHPHPATQRIKRHVTATQIPKMRRPLGGGGEGPCQSPDREKSALVAPARQDANPTRRTPAPRSQHFRKIGTQVFTSRWVVQ